MVRRRRFPAGRAGGPGTKTDLPRLLLFDLDPRTRALLHRHLAAGGFSVFEAETVEQARRLLAATGAEVVVTGASVLIHRA